MATPTIANLDDLGARAANLVATCDGGPTFRAELAELANDVKELAARGDGSASALSVLYQANDLLKVLRQHGNDAGPEELGSASWTLSGEIKRRLDTAIAVLDDAVPHPADDAAAGNRSLPDQALEFFLRLWRDVREMSPEQCAKELDERSVFEVARDLTGQEDTYYTISQKITSKGLRYEVAMARFIDKLLYGPDATDLQLD